ncbi:hypothetical protein EST38_g4859 [Candolleomyces aberdarensis]|uniref:Uncharacterized protein n=1 Tax=Candolleomyces aberdarensis TaxID=2316362 RepID=A0A4Q2DM01_9AGAR|nr:hypothetical protein EST38_g4859 [Candolleomyces aberdarensis]
MKATSLVLFLVYLTFALALSNKEKENPAAGQRRNELLKKLGLRPEARQQPQAGGVNLNDDLKMKTFAVHKPVISKGYIGVHKESIAGPLLGYLDCYKVVPTKNEATLYSFTVSGPVMEIQVVGSQERMAVVAGPLGNDVGPYSKNFHLPRHTQFSSIPGSGPNHDKLQAYLYETSVFSHSPDGGEIEVQWVNTNGQYTNTEIALMDDRIYYTGDISAFRSYTNMKVDHLAFKWNPAH